ncbi:MAG: aromatic ring-hydroxylating dioxygenase subunit alpha [Acidimicrobiia bacterium]|nr:aromatic ring-hydroxylating dioxygenase subunit alpha [Acidimicrobiia bacterium]
MTRAQLVDIARRGVAHYRAGTVDQESGIHEVPVANYHDADRWQLEMDHIFGRLPLMVAFSAELRGAGAYKAMDVAGMPVLLSRGDGGAVRAFVNMCSHRGAIVVADGLGTARRHACPYHSWTYDSHGDLVGIRDAATFGDVDKSCNGLTSLPVAERAGLVWVTLRPAGSIDIDAHLCGYGEMLTHLDFENCHVVGRQTVEGPGWKVAYDGYLDYYHLPVLHRESFGPDMSSEALFDSWGPHQRVTAPDRHFAELAELPEDEWTIERLIGGVWTIFPHVSIAAFDAGGKMYMVSQLFPGDAAGESYTIQNFLHTRPPDDEQAELVAERMAFLERVVRDEDYYTGKRIERTVRTGAKSVFMFGRNEGGGQRFHRWVDAVLATDDADLAELFGSGVESLR